MSAASALTLLDELLGLAIDERQARLAELARQQPELAAHLQRLLDADEREGGVLDSELSPQLLASVNPVAADQSGDIIGHYRLLERIGRGGMGDVYRAERTDDAIHDSFTQSVAIKLLRKGLDSEDMLRRFAQERRILARLEHPGIARLIDGGLAGDGQPWLAMECVEGETLTEYAANSSLGLRQRIALLIDVCHAIDYAHRRLVVHRDLKPSNVLVDRDGKPRVLDFGIAKLLLADDDALLTGTGMRLLSPAYAAPEQLRGDPVSISTDVHALGLLLYELLTGQLPQQRRTATVAALLAASDHDPESPSSLAEGTQVRALRGDLDTVVLKALSVEPDRRYASAAALADDLQRYLDAKPVLARPDTLSYRVGKFVRRHRGGVTAAVIAVLAVLGGLGVSLWQAHVAQQQAQRADAEAQRARTVKDFVIALYDEQDPIARARAQARSPAELVADGVSQARQTFAGSPDLLSDVLFDLGEVQLSLGDASAAASLQTAWDERRARLGDTHADSARAQLGVAASQVSQSRFADAEANARAALAVLDAAPDAQQSTAQAEGLLGRILMAAGDPAEALQRSQRAHELLVQLHGEDHPDSLYLLGQVGAAQERLDQMAAAEATLLVVLRGVEQHFGDGHARWVTPATRLADIRRRQQRYAEARPLLDKAVAIATEQLGPAHPLLGKTLLRQGDLLRRMGEYPAALSALDKAAACFAEGSPDLGQIAMFRGGVFRATKEHEAAVQSFDDSHRLFGAALGDDSIFTWMPRVDQGSELVKLGRLGEAEAVLQPTVERMLAIAGEDSFDHANAMSTLGLLRLAQGRHADAATLFSSALDRFVTLYGSAHPTTNAIRVELARAQRELGQLESSTALLDTALEGLVPDTSLAASEVAIRLERADLADALHDAARRDQELERIAALGTASLDAADQARYQRLRARRPVRDMSKAE